MMSGLCKRIGILAFLLSAVAIVNANASLGGRSNNNQQQQRNSNNQQQQNNNNQQQQRNSNNQLQQNNNNQQNNNIKTTTKKGSKEVTIKSVTLKMASSKYSGGYGLSVKLEHHGKSCQVLFGEMDPDQVLTKNAPASCEDLQLTKTSQIKVQVLSTDDNQFMVDSVKVGTTDGGFDVEFVKDKFYTNLAPGAMVTRRGK